MRYFMTRSKYFIRNINVLNIILAVFIVLMISYALSPFFYANVKFALPSLNKAPEEHQGISSGEFVLQSPSDYTLISEENLFHPERKIPPEKKVEEELPKPDFVLYGTLQTDDLSIAYIEDMKAPRSTAGRGRRQIALRKGDRLSGYTLKEISIDRIVMARGEQSITLQVIDPRKSKHGVPAAPAGNTAAAVPSPQTPFKPQTIPQSVNRVQQPPSPQSLIKPEPLTKKRAPMNPADSKIRDFILRTQ